MTVHTITQPDRLENDLISSQFESSILNILLLGIIHCICVVAFVVNVASVQEFIHQSILSQFTNTVSHSCDKHHIFFLKKISPLVKGKMDRNVIILVAITLLYLINVAQASIQWLWIKNILSVDGGQNSAAADYAADGFSWNLLVSNINAFLLVAVADGLLVRSQYIGFHSSLDEFATDLEMLLPLGQINYPYCSTNCTLLDGYWSVRYCSLFEVQRKL